MTARGEARWTTSINGSGICGPSLAVLVCHGESSPPNASCTTACKHARGWMMLSARICSTWGKVFDKGVYSRHCCPTRFSQQYCMWPRNPSSLMQPSLTKWRTTNEEKTTGRMRASHGRATFTDGGNRRRRGRRVTCAACCTRWWCEHRIAIAREA